MTLKINNRIVFGFLGLSRHFSSLVSQRRRWSFFAFLIDMDNFCFISSLDVTVSRFSPTIRDSISSDFGSSTIKMESSSAEFSCFVQTSLHFLYPVLSWWRCRGGRTPSNVAYFEASTRRVLAESTWKLCLEVGTSSLVPTSLTPNEAIVFVLFFGEFWARDFGLLKLPCVVLGTKLNRLEQQ